MTNSLTEGIAWVHAHPSRKNVPGARYRIGYGWSWSQLCVALLFWALGASHTALTARLAYAQSHLVPNTEHLPLPPGAISWFEYGADWHVGFGIGGNKFISATRFASSIAPSLGELTPQQYEQLSGGKYLGYSWDFCGQVFAGISMAGTGPVTPLNAPQGEIGMDKFAIQRTGSVTGLYVFDYSTKTYRLVDTAGEQYILGQEAAAGRLTIYPVDDATMVKSYGDWKPYTATPSAAGSTVQLQTVLDAIAALTKLETRDQTALIAAFGALPAAVREKIVAAP